ncbi:sulfatase-like hydrolase/transferase [Coraliomargarita sp. SDUM461004]|uniref:Sulfatase-like hydrolase/transferase n=1 Tax=Thalassobacterium sedimentorum TaxID=3041258 RepID=A0ABU1AH77_9BACT|nr:sulfatase-like hydrolase/transferase [Coraliomargarita sp. SDUM461004]MDQ8194062.1 sulfatase-like hydrolase/transferase [Coraliomargarita sp. SDUM461004]
MIDQLMQKPDILLIITDQQRWDSITCADHGWGHTPNIDRLANEGVYFEQCYCAAPSCVPSRASFFNMQWPSKIGPMKNGDLWKTSWVQLFKDTGYRTLNVGKMHTQPFDAKCGFDQRFIVENKDRFNEPRFYDDYDKHLKQLGKTPPNRLTTPRAPDYTTNLGAFAWPLDKELHYDYYVAKTAKWLLDGLDDSPLFMQIGFPGPHTPYDPPAEYLNLIDESKIPFPPEYEPGDEILPLKQYRQIMIEGNHDGIMWNERPTSEQLRRLRKYYAANVAMIDEQIGEIIAKQEANGRLDNTIIIFTSDHGDSLGDHRQIEKWTMYDENIRVPAIIWAPGRLKEGQRSKQLIAQMDLVPMLFELAGVQLEDSGDAINAKSVLENKRPEREYVYAEHGGCTQLPDIECMTMIRNKEYKLVHYPNRDYGELYNLIEDPYELSNLWNSKSHASIRSNLERQTNSTT